MEEDTERFFFSLSVCDVARVEECLDRGVDINSRRDGNTALHLATALHSSKVDNRDLVRRLLARGADPDIGNNRGNTALHTAARKNFPDILTNLLEAGVDKDKKNNNEETAMHLAADNNHVEIVKILLKFGASKTEKDMMGLTPLLLAINNKESSKDVTYFLIEEEGDINEQIGIGHATSLLLNDTACFHVFKHLVKKGLDINTRLLSKETYLTTALKLGNMDITEFLILNGAIVNETNSDDESPLQIALENKDKMYKMIILLMKRGVSFDYQKDAILPFIFKLEKPRQKEVVKVLLDKANETNFLKDDRIQLIFQSLKRLNTSVFDMMIKNNRKLWVGQETNEHEGEKIGLRESRTTRLNMVNAIYKAIEKDNNEFLTYVFRKLSLSDQAIFFSQENGIHHTMINQKTFLQEMAEKGDSLSKNREELIEMLIKIDNHTNYEKQRQPDRVIEQVKEGLSTSYELTFWLNSVKSRYVLRKSAKILALCLILGSFVLGVGLLSVDTGTDVMIYMIWSVYADQNSPFCHFHFPNETHYFMKEASSQKLSTGKLKGCQNDTREEAMRFITSEWSLLANISLFHILLNWIIFSVSFFYVNYSYDKFQGISGWIKLIFGCIFSPIATKWNVFCQNIKVTQLLATTPESFVRAETAKELKRIMSNQEKYKIKSEYPEPSFAELEDVDFCIWRSCKKKTDGSSVDQRRVNLWKQWKRNLQTAKDTLEEITEEDFVTWIKQKPNRDLVNMELDQDRIETATDEDVLYSWMKWKKNVELASAQNCLSLKTKQETLNLVIEVATEANFHFFIQVLLVFPNFIDDSTYDDDSIFEVAKKMLNWKVLSILSSFLTMAHSYSRIQILEKKYALSWSTNPKAFILLFLSITLHTACRMLVFAGFIYFTNPEGHFDIKKAVGLYSGHALIMIFFNIIFNSSFPTFSMKYILSIFLNSMTSFYSFSHFDFFYVRKKHKPTFMLQGFFTLIMLTENIFLTAYFALYSDSYYIENTYGVKQYVSREIVLRIVIAIIIFQIASSIVCFMYYANHPASVSVSRLKDKMQIYILGSSWVYRDGKWRKEIEEKSIDIELGTSLLNLYA